MCYGSRPKCTKWKGILTIFIWYLDEKFYFTQAYPSTKILNTEIVESEDMLTIRAVSNSKGRSKAFMALRFWVLCLEEGRHICPRVSLLTLQKAIPSISKIKQVCKRDPRSMNTHQPRHLAPVCFLSKWSWLLSRVANGIEIYWVALGLLGHLNFAEKFV